MGKIGLKSLKSGEIAQKRDFTPDFTRLAQHKQLCATVPSSSRCQARIGLLATHSQTQNKSQQLTR